MVLHWSLSDSKSPRVPRTRNRILAVLSNAVVWIVSTRPPISMSSRPFNNPLVVVPNAPITIGTILTFMFHSFFQFSSKVEVLIFLITYLQIYSVVRRESKVDNFTNFLFFFFVDYYKVSSSVRDQVIRLYVKVLSEFMCVIFWVVHIPFVCMVKFKFLAHLLVDHLADPVMSSLIFLLS